MTHIRKPKHPQTGTPRPVDIHVGRRLRMRRMLLGMSQDRLGSKVNLTFQQIQKYEQGTNRIGASRLFQLSRVLGVEVNYFFDEMPSGIAKTGGDYSTSSAAAPAKDDLRSSREVTLLVRAYCNIKDPDVRKKVVNLVKAFGNS